jgi:inner membrane protein
MDTLTHILTGVAVGQICSNEKDKWRPLIWGAIAGNIPDLDAIFQPFLSTESSMLFHRGISHSLFLWALCSPLLALLINKIYKGNKQSYIKWLTISVIAWFSHLFLDIFNTYGTGIFEPFSHARISFDLVNVVDLLYLIPILIVTIYFVFIIKSYIKKFAAAFFVILFPLIYIIFSCSIIIKVETQTRTQLADRMVYPNNILASPLPLSILSWRVVAETDDGYYIGVIHGFWKRSIPFDYVPKKKDIERKIEKYDNFQKLKQFTKGWYVIDYLSGQTVMYDLRFSTLGPQKSALYFPLHIQENSFDIGRASFNRHITPKNIRNYWEQLKKSE